MSQDVSVHTALTPAGQKQFQSDSRRCGNIVAPEDWGQSIIRYHHPPKLVYQIRSVIF